MQLRHQPAVLVLSRQPLPTLDRTQVRAGRGCRARRLRARRRARRQSRGDPHRLGQRGQPRGGGAREAARRGHPLARGLDAVLGHLRAPDAGVPGQRAAARRDGARRGRAGLDVRMGAIRRQRRPRHRHEDVRSLGAAQGAPAEVRLRAGARGRGRPRNCWAGGESMSRLATFADTATAKLARSARRRRRRRQLQRLLPTAPPASSCCSSTGTMTPSPRASFASIPSANRTYHYWHVFVPDVDPGQLYGYRVDGPVRSGERPALRSRPRFSSIRTAAASWFRRATAATRRSGPGDNAATAMKSVVVDPAAYDWEGDAPLRRPSSRTIIYEMHVRGFTRHPSSGLSPKNARHVCRPDREDSLSAASSASPPSSCCRCSSSTPRTAPPGLVNYWGYAPVSFFAPHQAYSSRQDPLGPVDEFRDMVKALHRAGIEVILDVVFNHTAEGDHSGPTLCFRGLDNRPTTSSKRTARATRTTAAPATRSTPIIRSSAG